MGQRFSLSLRFRFFAVLGGVLIVAMVALAAISKWLIFPALKAEERAAVQRELDRATRSLELNQESLLAQAQDWAHWDDTYQFIEGSYPRYAEVNFSQQMFEDMNYHLMAFFTLQGEVHFLAGLEPTTGRYQTCTAAVGPCAWMAPWVDTMQSAIATQVAPMAMYIEQWPALVAASHILHTDESGPPNGWLFKVRALDDAWLERMTDYTGLSLSLQVEPFAAAHSTELTFSGGSGNGLSLVRCLRHFRGRVVDDRTQSRAVPGKSYYVSLSVGVDGGFDAARHWFGTVFARTYGAEAFAPAHCVHTVCGPIR